jgi:hypothetical protein
MTLTPQDALDAAKLRHADNQKQMEERRAADQALPVLAEQKLKEIETILNNAMPVELRLETKLNPGELMDRDGGRQGIIGLYLKLHDRNRLFAEASIGIASDQSVELVDFTHHAGLIYRSINFAALKDEDCVEFLSTLITRHFP